LSPFRSSAVGLCAAFAAACVLFVPALAEADTSTAATPTTTAAAAAARLGTKTLRSGAHGARVKALQTLLSQAGFKTGTDGQYGASTVKTVRRFQRAANLKVTGVANEATLAALLRATDGSAAKNTAGGFDVRSSSGTAARHLGDRIPLRKGMSGHDVRILQDFLSRAGFTTKIDGEFGAGTLKAVNLFEDDQQRDADGVIDAADIDLLRSLVDGDDSATPATPTTPAELAPGDKAKIGSDGLAIAPANAPDAVKQIIAAGNVIAKKPYHYGGGHGKWVDSGYDCSGSVSYALHGAGLLDQALPSGDFMSWGDKGAGQWVTLYSNSGHMYMVIAGLRYDTSGRQQDGTRWHSDMRSSSGYTATHPTGL
jgi:peptidoglycan hydrolase-like protein with peptidoglycan-binding domain